MQFPSLRLRGIPTEELAVDLGSTHVYIFSRNRGLVVSEPAVAAVDIAEGEVIATGSEALELVGRLSGRVEVRHPLRDGAVADSELTEELLSTFLRRARGGRPRFTRRTVFAVPTGATDVERRAIRTVVERAAGGRVSLVDSLVAAALDVRGTEGDARSLLVVDIGATSTQAAVVVDSEVVLHQGDRVGSADMDDAIVELARRRHDLLIGERTAERLKVELGSAVPPESERSSEARGQSLLLGRPGAGVLTNLEVYDAIQPAVRRIVAVVRQVVSELPPEVAADVGEQGVFVVGGGSLLAGTVDRLSQELALPVVRADSPRQTVVRGAARLFDAPLLLRRVSRRAEERG